MTRNILVAVAWPYASGSRHLGHLAGAYLPADIFARYHRMAGNRVLMVSGSDVHGTPITVRADQEGATPQEIVDRFHAEFVQGWEDLAIQWELYTSTGTPNHHAVTQDMFRRLHENGYIDQRTSEQFYDPGAGRFLPDRYVEGTCPHCRYENARGDQCEECGRTLDPSDLLLPRSKLSGASPEMRPTDHFYLRLSDFENRLREWLSTRRGWRKHVMNFSMGWIEEGLRDRAITRDIDWGVDIPVAGLGAGKKIYVWFDAVIGYLSAAKEWAQNRGTPEAWRDWWENPEAEHYYFIGKDNIPFHTIIWPAMLMGYGGLELPADVPANQYVTFKGGKASASRGVGLTIGQALERYQPDGLRYALAANLPEQGDTEVSEEELDRRIDEELVSTWGNLAHRVLSMARAYCAGAVPDPGEQRDADREIVQTADQARRNVGGRIERVELKAGLREAMRGAAAVNAYLNAAEPWKTARSDPERTGTVLYAALAAVNHLRTALSPYLPVTCESLRRMMGGAEVGEDRTRGIRILSGGPPELSEWERPFLQLRPGAPLGEIAPLYRKTSDG